MKVALIIGSNDTERKELTWLSQEWKQVVLAHDPSIEVCVYPHEIADPNQISALLVSKYPRGILKLFPNAKAIINLAAGVDYLMHDKELPNLPIVRLVDDDMAKDLAQYTATYVLSIIKRVDHWQSNQQQQLWAKTPPFNYPDKVIGIMGLGFMGNRTATMLRNLDLNVIGWSRSPKPDSNISCYSGDKQLSEFLSKTDILVCMLPLTPATTNILNYQLFTQLKPGAYIINLGRGKHLVDNDLITALDNGTLDGAILDVFRQEPLDEQHPFWTHPKITLTPHIASMGNPRTAAPQVVENIQRLQSGQDLINKVDMSLGY